MLPFCTGNRIMLLNVVVLNLRRIRMIASLFVVGLIGLSAFSQEKPPTDAGEKTSLREQTIYVPYEKLREVFEREGRGVFLPYDKFQELWKAAQAATKAATPAGPPVDGILVSAENEAEVEREVMVVKSKLTIELIKTGWQKIPIQLGDSAILSATVAGQVARVVHEPDRGYSLLIENKETQPALIVVELQYAKAYAKTPGQNSVSFLSPLAPVNRWRVRIPDSGVKVQVEPMLAATEVQTSSENRGNPSNAEPNAESNTAEPYRGTEVLAFVGAAPTVSIRWVPKSEGATGLAALATVNTQHRVVIDEGIVRSNIQMQYAISRSELSRLTIEIPGSHKIVNVVDPNIKKWAIEDSKPIETVDPKSSNEPNATESTRRLIIDLFEPARQSQSLAIEMESLLAQKSIEEDSIPSLRAIDAFRQQGIIAIRSNSGLRSEPIERVGLLQIDNTEIPEAWRNEPWNHLFRYTTTPYLLKLKIEKTLPTIKVDQLVELYLTPQMLAIDLTAFHTIENGGVFQLSFQVPTGFEVTEVQGINHNDVQPAPVDSFRIEGEQRDRLVVQLKRKAQGKVGLLVRLQKKITDPNLSKPTGVTSTIEVPTVRSIDERLSWLTGAIVIYGAESLRINPTERKELRDSWPQEVYSRWNTARSGQNATTSYSSAYVHANEPTQLSLSVERRKPMVTVRQSLVTSVSPGFVSFVDTLVANVQFSGVPSLRIDVPLEIAKDIRIETPGVKESPIEPQPTNVTPGHVAWALTNESEWIGEKSIRMTWQRKLEDLDVGKSLTVDVPHLMPKDTERSWGQVIVKKSDAIDVQEQSGSVGLRPIDPRFDLFPGIIVENVARAFEFQSDWKLQLAATRYALEDVRRTSIERSFIRAVVTRSNQIGIQALYRVQSARQSLAIKLPKDAQFDSQPLFINGQSFTLERGDKDQLFVPLAGRDPTQAFLLELRYTIPTTIEKIELPQFPDDPATQKTYACVFIPTEKIVLGKQGNWTPEFSWARNEDWNWTPQFLQTQASIESWVKEGIAVQNVVPFQVDGTAYIYSTMGTPGIVDETLRLVTIDQRLWTAAVIAVIALLGLLMLRQPFRLKLIAIAIVATLVLVCGAFTPTLARQMLNMSMFTSSSIMLLIWCSHWLWIQQKNITAIRKLKRAASESPTKNPTENPIATSPKSEETVNAEPAASIEGSESATIEKNSEAGDNHA